MRISSGLNLYVILLYLMAISSSASVDKVGPIFIMVSHILSLAV